MTNQKGGEPSHSTDMKNITHALTPEQQTRYKKYRAELPLKLLATFDAGRMLSEIPGMSVFTRLMVTGTSSYSARMF